MADTAAALFYPLDPERKHAKSCRSDSGEDSHTLPVPVSCKTFSAVRIGETERRRDRRGLAGLDELRRLWGLMPKIGDFPDTTHTVGVSGDPAPGTNRATTPLIHSTT